MKIHLLIRDVYLFLAYCLISMLCGVLLLYYRDVILSGIIDTKLGEYYTYATPAMPFALLSFLFVQAMKKFVTLFRLDKKKILTYIAIYIFLLVIIYYYVYMYSIGNAENRFPRWLLFLIPPLIPAYTIAFAGNIFLFMRWDAALALHLLIYLFSFGIPFFGLMALVIYIPFNVFYYGVMIWWSRKSLWPSG